jgi:hypothetical protein
MYSSSSGHEVRPIHDLFRSHDFIRPVISLTVVQSSSSDRSIVKELFWVSYVFHSTNMIQLFLLILC